MLYLALRLAATTDKSRPLIPDRRVTLDEALDHPHARKWASDTLDGLSSRLRDTLVAWADHQLSAKSTQDALGIQKTEFHRRKLEASEATQLGLSLPGPKLELLIALYITGSVTMESIDITDRTLDGAAGDRGDGLVHDGTDDAALLERADDGFDTTEPDASRVYNLFLGESENYPADRVAAASLAAVWPGTETACRLSRAFVLSATEYTVRKGVRQIIDMGCGILTKRSDNVHQVAQRILPSARVVYIDKNPLVRRYFQRDLAGVEGCIYLHHDFLAGAALYEQPQIKTHLRLDEPVTLLLGNLLHFVPGDIAYSVVADLVRPLAPGSRLVVASIASDLQPAMMQEAVADYSGRVTTSFARSREEIARFFDGLRLEEPGIVSPPQWHGNPGDVFPPPEEACTWAAMGVVG